MTAKKVYDLLSQRIDDLEKDNLDLLRRLLCLEKPRGWYVPTNKQRYWLRQDGYAADVTFESREECSEAIERAMERQAFHRSRKYY
jgi:hypothetical protein